MTLREQILAFKPGCEQEESDRRVMLRCLDTFSDLLTRDNETAHFTASAWITDPQRTQVLMIYHNIYDSWAWTGGHCDGEPDLLKTALREVAEETGCTKVRPISQDPISLEILPVNAHIKRGRFVSPHLHLNLTYLLEAAPAEQLRIRPDENSGVRWFGLEEAINASNEVCMKTIYQKLNGRIPAVGGENA